MRRITAAAKALLLAVFALLSLMAAADKAVAGPPATGSAAVAEPDAEPVVAQGSCSPALPDADTHPGQARRAHRPETGAPQTAARAVCALSSPPAALPRHAAPADGAPHCHAPSRSGDFSVALQVFRC
ncbi:hypothetical protein [Streptomyces sp. NPDC055287]